MADNAEQPDEAEDLTLEKVAALLPDEPSPLRELALHTHELYLELKEAGFPPRVLSQILAIMLSDVVTGRIFEDLDDDDDWDDIDEGDKDNDGKDLQ